MTGIRATAEVSVNASIDEVWEALVNPSMIEKYFFGTKVTADWSVGGKIIWTGQWQGKEYKEWGNILEVSKPNRLVMNYFSPSSGQEDKPENYSLITYDLSDVGGTTKLSVTQENLRDQKAADDSLGNWAVVLKGLKELVENGQNADPS